MSLAINLIEISIVNQALRLVFCYGLGGVGKTQLALEFFWKSKNKYKNIFWFSTETEEKLIEEYIIFDESKSLGVLDKKDKQQPKDKILEVSRYLQNNRKNWLLIYDNASTYTYKKIQYFLPGH